MRRRGWLLRAVLCSAVLAGCNALSGVGDYTFFDLDASADATTDGTDDTGAVDAASADADATVVVEAGPGGDGGDGGKPVPCELPSPSTGNRVMECGTGTCNLDVGSPPPQCCEGTDASDGRCVDGPANCPNDKFRWTCTRSFQCPFPSYCCLAASPPTPTCPPTARAIESSCIDPAQDAGCAGNIELCTGNEGCRLGRKCQRLDILGPGTRSIGACL